jgi:hypothetical protein
MLLVVRAVAGSSASGNKETLTATVWLLATPSAKPPWAGASRAARRGRVLVGGRFAAPSALGLLLPSGMLLVG